MKRAKESEIRYGAVSFQYDDDDDDGQEPEDEAKQQDAGLFEHFSSFFLLFFRA